MQLYTIIATSYNDEHEIGNYLSNVVQQRVLPKEIIIADGGSKDNTVFIVKEFSKKSPVPIRLVMNGRLNISQGYNLAVKHVKTPYILITGIGNIYDKNFSYECLKKIDDDGSDLIYGPIKGVDKTKFSRLFNKAFLNGNDGKIQTIGSNHGVMINKAIFEKFGYFLEGFKYAGEDTEYYYMLKKNNISTSIAENAIVFWKTPQSTKEFIKQRKNYTIAELQLEDLQKSRNKYCKCFTLILAFSALLISLLIYNKYALLIFILLSVIYLCYKEKSFSPDKVYILTLEKILDTYYRIKYNKYSHDSYKVIRKK